MHPPRTPLPYLRTVNFHFLHSSLLYLLPLLHVCVSFYHNMVVMTRSSQRQADASRMEKVHPDIMVSILQFVTLPDRVRLASCSTLLQTLIYNACTALWVDIDFEAVEDRQMTLRLTDQMLASLLQRVNAQKVTESLNLRRCVNLRGMGLKPLRYSRVLERVELLERLDLRCYDMDKEIAIRILRTMIPYNLFQVHFFRHYFFTGKKGFSEHTRGTTKFLRDLRAAKLQQALEQNIACSSCQEAVVDKSQQVVTDVTGVPSHKCAECKHHFCRRGSCPVSLKDCYTCLDAHCSDCGLFANQCDGCTNSLCTKCYDVASCDACNKRFCQYKCNGVVQCSCCDKRLCNRCNRREQGDVVAYCFKCGSVVCRDCREVFYCWTCSGDVCEECAEFQQCDSCALTKCKDHFEVTYLECCGEMACTACVTPHLCDGSLDSLWTFHGVEVETCGMCCEVCNTMRSKKAKKGS